MRPCEKGFIGRKIPQGLELISKNIWEIAGSIGSVWQNVSLQTDDSTRYFNKYLLSKYLFMYSKNRVLGCVSRKEQV